MGKYYHFSAAPRLSQHFSTDIRLVQDTADDFGSEADLAEMLMRAKVQSGDYLVTLITELERVAAELPAGPAAIALEAQIHELIAIDKHYMLCKRPTNNP